MTDRDAAQRPGVTPIEGVDANYVTVNRFRRGRFALFLRQLDAIADRRATVKVLDVGGTRGYWEGLRTLWRHLPLDITIVNIGATPAHEPPYRLHGGNACDLGDYASDSFDIVHSNSVIEHVGDWIAMAAMAREVRRLAPRYFVQTPNFWFPLEPHYRTVGFQWLPESTRAALLVRRRFGFCGPEATFDAAMCNVQAHRLLTTRQMRALFPDGLIVKERVLGLPKSLIAIRS